MPKSLHPGPLRVYCAGPLFNQSERQEMTAIAVALCDAGYDVYLPHRDGMEFRLVLEVLVERGWDSATAAQFLHAAIFALDVYQLAVECDVMVWNLNGRCPDEGAVSEAAMAWTLGKPLVAYKDDVRSLILNRMNPLLVGMVDFVTVENIGDIAEALGTAIESHEGTAPAVEQLPARMRRAVREGQALWTCICECGATCQNELLADCVTELFAPEDHPLARPLEIRARLASLIQKN